MKTTMRYWSILTVCVPLALSALAASAMAQSDAVRALYISAGNIPTNMPRFYTYAAPPKGFNPVAATDEELATYGFPPRPDQQADPDHYALWERAMLAAKIRWNGELKPLPAPRHGMIPAGSRSVEAEGALPAAATKVNSVNWSGVVLRNPGLKTWSATASFADIWTEISVPTTEPPFGDSSCSSTLLEFSWTGIDGYDPGTLSNGALQGGVASEAFCSGLSFHTAYASWGTPNLGGAQSFPVHAGDVFYTEVIGFGGTTNGSVFAEDLTTLTYYTYSVVSDGIPLIGNSAEWIVERPCCNGSVAWPLANTISIFFDGGAVYNTGRKIFYPGSQATTTNIVTMRDDGNTQNIEIVNQGSTGYEGLHALLFQTTGCAFSGGC